MLKKLRLLQGIFSLDELMAREVMVPRTDAFMIDINDDTQENIQEILKQNFSRIPVYDDDKDKIVGVLHTKRLLDAGFRDGFDNIVLRKILQEPLFVPETIFCGRFVTPIEKYPKSNGNFVGRIWWRCRYCHT